MFTLQLPSDVPATGLVPMLGMALLSLLACGSGLLWMRWLRRGSLPLVHAILVISLLMPLAAPLAWAGAWAVGWSPIRLIAIGSDPGLAPPPAARLEKRSPMPAPSRSDQSETAAPGRDATAPDDRTAPATPPLPVTTSLPNVDDSGHAGAPLAQSHPWWQGTQGIAMGIAVIWLWGTAYQLVWLGRGLLRVRRFKRTVRRETDPELLNTLQSVAEQFRMTTCPVLGRSAATVTPLSLGLWRPRIILPAGASGSRWSAQAWRPLLIHELAHIHRRDHLVGLMQRLALAVYWWNPLAWAVSRELSLVRELICDDLATCGMSTGETSPSRQYAGLLIDLAERVADRGGAQPDYVSALAAWNGPRDDLSRRIHRLLDPNRQVVTTLSRKARIARGGFSLAMLLLVLAIGVRVDHVAAEPPAADPSTEKVMEITAEGEDNGVEQAVEMLEATLLVVDHDGQPIAGAQVTPSALSLQGGSSMGWTNGQKAITPEPLVTDDQGVAVIRYPKYGLPDMQSTTQGLFCHIDHSDYAAKMSELISISLDNPTQVTTVRLSRGAQLELVPRLNGERVTSGKLFADWTSRAYAPHLIVTPTPSGHLKLPRLNPGAEIVRVAYISEAGERYFSQPERLELKEGDRRLVDLVLEPAVVVRGKLDDSVPRPITGGRVVGVVAERGESMFALLWQSYAEVDQQGNFTLEPMPPGTLQVIALCDGYMAKADDPPAGTTEAELWTKLSGRPQTFELDDELTEITVAMTPTATAVVRLLSPQGEPVPKTRISFNPNVFWKHGYAQIYCYPLTSSWKAMLDPASIKEQPFDTSTLPFSAETDAEGMAVVANLPPGLQPFSFTHDRFQLAEIQGTLVHNSTSVELVAGETNEFLFTLQAKQDAFAPKQQTTRDQLKAIGAAFHQFHAVHGRFPGTSNRIDGRGKYPLSWRVAILPYLGEQDLYNQYRQDEPWDSEHNRTLLAKMPTVYQSPNTDTDALLSPAEIDRGIVSDADVVRLRTRAQQKRAQMRQMEDNDLVRIRRDWYDQLAKEVAVINTELRRAEAAAREKPMTPDEIDRDIDSDADVIRLRRRAQEKSAQMRQMEDNDLVRIRRDWYDALAKDVAAIQTELRRAEAAARKKRTTPDSTVGPAIPMGETHYQGFAGKQTALGTTRGVPIPEFTDGTSTTLLIVETRLTVPWTQPSDLPFAEPEDAQGVVPFKGVHPGLLWVEL